MTDPITNKVLRFHTPRTHAQPQTLSTASPASATLSRRRQPCDQSQPSSPSPPHRHTTSPGNHGDWSGRRPPPPRVKVACHDARPPQLAPPAATHSTPASHHVHDILGTSCSIQHAPCSSLCHPLMITTHHHHATTTPPPPSPSRPRRTVAATTRQHVHTQNHGLHRHHPHRRFTSDEGC